VRLAGKRITSIAILIAIIIQSISVTGIAYDNSIPGTKGLYNSSANELVDNKKK